MRYRETQLRNLFLKAVREGDLVAIGDLVTREGVDPAVRFGAALCDAISSRYASTIDLLKRLGATFEVKHLRQLIEQERSDFNSPLIKQNLSLLDGLSRMERIEFLILAGKNNHLDVVKYLLCKRKTAQSILDIHVRDD